VRASRTSAYAVRIQAERLIYLLDISEAWPIRTGTRNDHRTSLYDNAPRMTSFAPFPPQSRCLRQDRSTIYWAASQTCALIIEEPFLEPAPCARQMRPLYSKTYTIAEARYKMEASYISKVDMTSCIFPLFCLTNLQRARRDISSNRKLSNCRSLPKFWNPSQSRKPE
jgi:hypothetical protein